jgi:hypothetical protein
MLKLLEVNTMMLGIIIARTHCGAWWKLQQCCIHAEKSVINMIWHLFSISDWSIIMIGPGGLLLVVPSPTYSAIPISVLGGWGGVAKKIKRTKLWCEKYFCKGPLLSTTAGDALRGLFYYKATNKLSHY